MENQWTDAASGLTNAVLKKIARMEHSELRALLPELFSEGGALATVGDKELSTLQVLIDPATAEAVKANTYDEFYKMFPADETAGLVRR